MLSKNLLLSIFLGLSVLYASAQTKTLILPRPNEAPPPGNMKLLNKYFYKKGWAIDAAVGTISKENGLQIEYSSGLNMGNFAADAIYKERRNVVWIKDQEVNNKKVLLVYLNDGRIYATFEERTNFTSTVKTNEELTDFLIMIMTYGSKDEKGNPSKTKN
ncbi:MAG TPA: hypothetical protein PKY82_02165 [Pyrinomonadaceae bacterium]|nr:hypothetical protein [Pyrinomonadaceae bacterium]